MTKSKNCFLIPFQFFKFGSRKGQNDEDWKRIAAQEQKLFSFQDLVAATKNFHPNHKLGEGGFGPVYKGKLDDGREIAVKMLSHSSHQGKKEFTNEARLLSRVQHRNVVTLLGYCIHGEEKLLVYEYVRRESLDKLLFKSKKRVALDWNRRLEIITGIARGLLYLHEDAHCCIIHRDIKASNILLDENWVPKIADFGMARLFSEEETQVNTRVAGTNGYMAPEYVMHGQLSVKADVFSFGVLLLEMISGQKNYNFTLDVDAQNLLDWAYKMYKEGRGLEIMDSALASSADPEKVASCIQIGLLCTQVDPQLRPNMQRVLVMLSRRTRHLEEPGLPGVPGSSYKRTYKLHGSPSAAGSTSGESGNRSNNTSLNTNTASASTSTFATVGPAQS